ncbi:MAG TPA: PadR family transcriptional regulator [Gemmatimonadaceae bacterium]|nr:PadR family transcriptional regulator [Gemmatimonadaceae bacterium]
MFRAFAFGGPMGNWCASGRSRWGWGEGFGSEFWGGGPFGRHRRGRMGRMFEQGDLKYVILRLLEEKPRHGYEIIKELEDRFGGAYSPSPGTVYPTLTMLEDLGYAKANQDEGGRKVYEVTPEGSAYLKEHSTTVDSIFERIGRFMEGFLDEPMMEVNSSFRRVARSTYTFASRNVNDRAKLERIKEILDRAAADLEELEKNEGR